MLPSWFAEYSLDLVIVALAASCAVAAYGWLVLSTGRFAGMLRDVDRANPKTHLRRDRVHSRDVCHSRNRCSHHCSGCGGGNILAGLFGAGGSPHQQKTYRHTSPPPRRAGGEWGS